MGSKFDFEKGEISVNLLWFDSMGAKSTSALVETPDLKVCIDPGVAAMQPSYPLSDLLKEWYRYRAKNVIYEAVSKSDLVTISHYHYDHFFEDPKLYEGKELWIKDPNRWINKSQWERARNFLENLADSYGESLEKCKSQKEKYEDPYNDFEIAKNKDFGDYQDRREELLDKWRKRFLKLTDKWSSEEWIKEPNFANYGEGRKVEKGGTEIRFRGPLFHGIEYAKTGWVFSTIIEYDGVKFIHSSDLQGPTIEDHAEWIIKEDPDILILDGPATYLYGYLLNKTNLQRSIDNAHRIAKEIDPDLMIWDHHLLREKRYRERTGKVWNLKDEGFNIKTAAEVKGKKPLISKCIDWEEEKIKKMEEKAREEMD